jgi:hypothetical protein
MRCTETEKSLLLKQLRKSRDEIIRSKMMMEAVASDEGDDDTVEDLEEMATSLENHIDAIVKSELIDDDEEDEDDDEKEN